MSSSGAAPPFICEYTGWSVPKHGTGEDPVPRVSWASLDHASMWSRFVHARRPCILTHALPWQALAQKWSNDYLRGAAGRCVLRVERRENTDQDYGRGVYERMTFAAFLDRVERGDQLHYVTTQPDQAIPQPDAGEAFHVVPPEHPFSDCLGVVRPPMSHLLRDLEHAVPAIMGNLVPWAYNIWMGNSQQGSSSGLHHDHHDNLYVLLRGCKRFLLWSPDQASVMHTHGRVAHVHANGRINYVGQEPTHDDGSLAYQRSRFEALQRVQAEAGKGSPHSSAGNDTDSATAQGAGQGGFVASDAATPGEGNDSSGDVDWDAPDDFDDADVFSAESDGEEEAELDDTPDHFCTVDPVDSDAALMWPEFAAAPRLSVYVRAGECLYLPAGWFHHVTSWAETSGDDPSTHLALNYWFHPPSMSATGVQHPYVHPFWTSVWEHARGMGGDLQQERPPSQPQQEE